MGVLLQFLVGIFTYFANFAIAKLGARFGIRLALVAFWLASTATLTASINGVISALQPVMHPAVSTAISLLPPSTGLCLSAIAACRAACWLYITGVYVASSKARV